ncbi:MAG: PASTA domain-containing protein [Clostridia bacterium]
MSEVLPELDIASNSSSTSDDSSNNYSTKELPDVRNMSISQAKKILKDCGFNVNLTGNEDTSTLIIDQNPKPGVSLIKGSNVFLYTENNNIKSSVTVPNFKGMTAAQAINSANSKGLNLVLEGSGVVISQNTASGTEVEIGSVITVNLRDELNGGY